MQRIYQPVGQCIFCSPQPEPPNTGQFTDEHIIAYSLGGKDVLPNATCERHQEITKKFDEQIACDMLKVYRHANDMPSRSGSSREPFYKISVTNGQTGFTYIQELPVSQAPTLHICPHLLTPGILVGAPAEPIRMGHVLHSEGDDKLRNFMRKLPPGASASWTSGDVLINDFARMLAKVAHTYATAELGHGNFTPALLEVIEGKSPNPFHFVGGFEPSAPQEVSSLTWREEVRDCVRYVVVSISFKCLRNMPRFQVVVGSVLDPSPFPERSKKAQDAAQLASRQARIEIAKARGLYGSNKKK